MRRRCVVVGGGVAGLAAAGRLAAAGLKVTLLEARARLGGRVHTQTRSRATATRSSWAPNSSRVSHRICSDLQRALGSTLDELPEQHR